jgi:glycosyltransferase involved in cell wall biosynthesis
MRVAYIIPGSGDSFYCQNCIRDAALIRSLRNQGHDVVAVPLYLPLLKEAQDLAEPETVFFGAVNLYLSQRIPAFRNLPGSLQRLLNSFPVLKMAAKKSGSVEAHGLGKMTLSMLSGRDPAVAEEVTRMTDWLGSCGEVDVVHFSNALLLGLAPSLRNRLDAAVVCSLQDENHWLDSLEPPYRKQCWGELAEQAGCVDVFIPVSNCFSEFMRERTGVERERMRVVYPGIEVKQYSTSPLPSEPPVIGYLARLSESMGLESLVEAFMLLKKRKEFAGARLKLAGGATKSDRPFIKSLMARLKEAGLKEDCTVLEDFGVDSRKDFFASSSLLCVPCVQPEAMGGQVLEAFASGVPVVHPAMGGGAEIIEASGGGLITKSSDARALEAGMAKLLGDPALAAEMGRNARAYAERELDVVCASEKIAGLYEDAANSGRNV